jgi:signal peptidase I
MSEVIREEKEIDFERSWESVLWEWVKTIIYALILALFIRAFFLQTFKIPTGSMEPTLRGAMNYGSGDKIIVIKLIYGIKIPFINKRIFEMTEPKRGDVVVFKTRNIPLLDQRKDFIKRVAGLGGERLQIMPDNPEWNPGDNGLMRREGHIYVNGKRLETPDAVARRSYYPDGEFGSGEVIVPKGHYFMLGDNALNSQDSRYWGFVPRENIVGKAVAIYWPPKRIGLID